MMDWYNIVKLLGEVRYIYNVEDFPAKSHCNMAFCEFNSLAHFNLILGR